MSTVSFTGYTTIILTTLSIPPPETTFLNAPTVTFTPEPSTVVLTTAIPTTFVLTETTTADQATLTLNLTQTEISSYFETYTTSLEGLTTLEVRTTTLDQPTFTLPTETSIFYSTAYITSLIPASTETNTFYITLTSAGSDDYAVQY